MIHGHHRIVEMILGARTNDRLSHAYLFVGPENIGKCTTATTLARALVCEKPTKTGEFCGSCGQCKVSALGAHPDIIVLTRDAEKKEIGIDAVRALRTRIEQTSFFMGYRVVVIDEADTMTTEAANALLRMLEEPRGKTVFFLCAANGRRVLPTIRSRAVIIHFEPLAPSKVESILESEGIARSQATMIANITRGRIGTALTIANDPEALEQFNIRLTIIRDIIVAPTWSKRRGIVEKNLTSLTSSETLDTIAVVLNEQIKKDGAPRWTQCLKRFADTVHIIQTSNVQPLFAFEQFLLSLP